MLAYCTNFTAQQVERQLKKEDTEPVRIKRFYQDVTRRNWNKRLMLEEDSDLKWKSEGRKREWKREWGNDSESDDELTMHLTYIEVLGWMQEVEVAGRESPVVSRLLVPLNDAEYECTVVSNCAEIEMRQVDMYLKDDECDIEATVF